MGNCTSAVYEEGDFQAHIAHINKDLPQISDINILSYNIFVRPPMINSNGDDYKDERLSEFAKVAKNYDIICLQEMFGAWSDRKEQLVETAKKLGFLFHAMPQKPATLSHLLIDGGLLILSRFPIEKVDFCPYASGIGSDFVVEKGALYARVRIGNSRLHLYTTHAQATYDGTLKYFIKRTEQFIAFQNFIKRTLKENDYTTDDMVLLTGDFNVDGRTQQKFQSNNAELVPVFQKFKNLNKSSSFGEYEALISCLSNDNEDKVEDLLYSNHKEHPITFGDYYLLPNNEKKPRESVLTDKSCQCVAESLDYIFKYTPKSLTVGDKNPPNLKSKAKQSLVIKENSAVVEKFLLFGHRFDQLSDHYGVQVTLQYKQNKQADNEDADTDSGSPYLQSYQTKVAQLE